LLAATVRSFAHIPLGVSDRNSSKVLVEAYCYATSVSDGYLLIVIHQDAPEHLQFAHKHLFVWNKLFTYQRYKTLYN